MQRQCKNPARWWLAVLLGLVALSTSFAFAANGIRVAAEPDLAFADDDVLIDTVGIRLEIDHGLRVVVTPANAGLVGDVFVPTFSVTALPTNPRTDHALDLCVCRIGIVRRYPGGVAFVLEENSYETVMAALMTHLRSIGARIGAVGTDGHAFDFTAEGGTFRALVGEDPHGTVVYLGGY
jgi:hypothetical protein